MKIPHPVTIDFETDAIQGRPLYPPVPVGVSIKLWGQKPRYYAWGHPDKNNCKKGDAIKALKSVWGHGDGLLFQNGKFDVDVAETHMGLPRHPWDSYHDTLFLLFLDDPHQRELSLKPSAERLLKMPPDERDAVADWLVHNQPPHKYNPDKKITYANAGAYICLAPGDLVGEYANGDVTRTEKIFKLLYPKTVKRKMLDPYNRERKLMPILLDNERQGIRIDLKRLRKEVSDYRQLFERIDKWLYKQLGGEFNVSSNDELAKRLVKFKKAKQKDLGVTATGKMQTNKEALENAVQDKQLLNVLRYRAQLKTCLGTFMEPWLTTAAKSDGLIFTSWNQVRSPKRDGTIGTRTGRLSSTPNFQNIPNEFKPLFAHEEAHLPRKDRKKLPKAPFKGFISMPMCRSYIIPWEKDHVLVDRDYSQQEPRILAHFEAGALQKQYLANPWIDFHDNAKESLERVMNRKYERKPVKNINLGLIYGEGVAALAIKNNSTVAETKQLKDAILAMYPGLKEMYKDMKARAAAGEPIRTWGGREYFCEPPAIVDGRYRTFDYKMVNVLIQGSAADCTKEAIIRYHAMKPKNHIFYLNVHDQLTTSVPKKDLSRGQKMLQRAMESVEFGVPMLSEGAMSNDNWAALKAYDKKGKLIHTGA